MMIATTDTTLDFLADLAEDGLREIRRKLFLRIDELLLVALTADGPPPPTPLVTTEDFGSIDDSPGSIGAPESRSGRATQFTSSRVIRDLRRLGFVRRKSTGGHRIFIHPTRGGGHVAVPHHPGDLARGTLTNILRQAAHVLGGTLVIDPKRSRLVVRK